jgi:hypothetical protein
MDYEDKRVRRTPEYMFLGGLGIALVGLAAGIWWALPTSVLCLVPAMAPKRFVCGLFPKDEEWIARIKLGLSVMVVVVVAVVVACLIVLPSLPGWDRASSPTPTR